MKDVTILVHGFIGDPINTWGKPNELRDNPRFNAIMTSYSMAPRRRSMATRRRSMMIATKLDRALSRLEENYRTVTLLARTAPRHANLAESRDGISGKATLRDISRCDVHASQRECVAAQHPELVKLLGDQSMDIGQLQASAYSELSKSAPRSAGSDWRIAKGASY